jgi:hypothetical protein
MNGIEFIVNQMEATQLPAKTRAELRERVVRLSLTKSQREVAMEVGLSRSTVFNLLQEHLRGKS